MRNFVGIFVLGLMGMAIAQEKANAADDIATVQDRGVPNVRKRREGWSADKPGCSAALARQAYEAVGREQRSCLGQNLMNLPGTSASNSYVQQLMNHCTTSDRFNQCLDDAVSNNKYCLYKQYNDIVRPRTKSYKAALEYFCDYRTGANECWNSKSEAQNRCTKVATNGMTGYNMSLPSSGCRGIELFQSCMANELKSCPNPKVADIFNELWDATKMATPCSASMIANVLIVTVTTALLSMRLA